jgi:hypothetical protein
MVWGASKRLARSPQNAIPERRAHIRFRLTLAVHFTASGREKPVELSTGYTIDLSSSGLRFRADNLVKPLPTGQSIHVYIDWPVLLDQNVNLQLDMSGVVVRTDGREVAVQVYKHRMKTRTVGERSA